MCEEMFRMQILDIEPCGESNRRRVFLSKNSYDKFCEMLRSRSLNAMDGCKVKIENPFGMYRNAGEEAWIVDNEYLVHPHNFSVLIESHNQSLWWDTVAGDYLVIQGTRTEEIPIKLEFMRGNTRYKLTANIKLEIEE